MEPEEVDKLFKERLGRVAPTPPADLWNRLQERMQEELPQATPQIQPEEHQEKRRLGFLYYSIAAAIALLLAVGVVLKLQQPQTITDQTIASADVTTETIKPAEITLAPEVTTEQSIAAVTTPDEETTIASVTEEPTIVAEQEKAVAKKPVIKPRRKAEQQWVKVEAPQQPAMLAQQKTKPEEPKQEPVQAAMQTPVAFASANSAEPVEIIIKRSVSSEVVAMASADEPEETSSFDRKQRLAKNIFKQVKNLSNGEKINLADVGLNADKIALETKIGKQKISKVINL
ncbi:hypothetical protein H8S95_05010 [Pontibacter sp. KCTC 32443]|uniref:hypothetical protein n=1 Tax=Pontibacter TaxID=323449 RepID=UPI00164DE7C6|nr:MULTISPECIES: hypothetical protein [Pontibacter]MBC5773415.1 hypothetical protein [Pontibacter sp. KCTC 32443]